MKRYEFTITLSGCGETPDEAWLDATIQFSLEPGSTPEDYTEETEDDE